MGILKTNIAVGELEGTVGNLVLAKHKPGEKVVRKRPVRTAPLTEAEKANQCRFARAVEYAKSAWAQAELRAVYKAAARLNGRRAFNMAQSDFLTPPVVEDIDAAAYTGKAGDMVRIKAVDDFRVCSLRVQIRDLAGSLLEEGAAIAESAASLFWLYRAQSILAPGQTIVIEASAADLPGNVASKKIDHALIAAP